MKIARIHEIFRNRLKNLLAINFQSSIDVLLNKKANLLWSMSEETKNNFGDAINPFLFKHITGRSVVNANNVINFALRNKYYFLGSVLDNMFGPNIIVCGAGFKSENSKIFARPKDVLAVRGPLSRRILLSYDIECPEVYCDPAVLLPYAYPVKVNKKYDVGIIPHYIDKPSLDSLNIISNNTSYKVIDITDRMDKVIHEICSCKNIISSSLHGIIVAHAYGIPAVWLKLSDRISGGNFKFYDYFASVNLDDVQPTVSGDQLIISDCLKNLTFPNTRVLADSFTAHVLPQLIFHLSKINND